jgi:hypothetical protein
MVRASRGYKSVRHPDQNVETGAGMTASAGSDPWTPALFR